MIIEAAQKHTRGFIPVDFRYYKDLNSGSTIFTSISDDESLDEFLQYSKFTQQVFILMNFNEVGIKIIPGKNVPATELPKTVTIPITGLKGVELVFNMSEIGTRTAIAQKKVVTGNLKFAKTSECPPISIIAENVPGMAIDLREAEQGDFLAPHHDIKVLSLKNSKISGGKWTKGNFENVFNDGLTGELDKYRYCEVEAYSDPEGNFLGD